jgi:hypothetical protein
MFRLRSHRKERGFRDGARRALSIHLQEETVDRITLGTNGMIERIGEVAGRVWRQLRAHGPASVASLAKSIGRSEPDIHMAIGWLAREGKVRALDGDRLTLVEQEMRVAI